MNMPGKFCDFRFAYKICTSTSSKIVLYLLNHYTNLFIKMLSKEYLICPRTYVCGVHVDIYLTFSFIVDYYADFFNNICVMSSVPKIKTQFSCLTNYFQKSV